MALITKSMIELELLKTLPTAYTDIAIAAMSDDAEAIVKMDTNRSTFTGISATLYNRAVLLAVVNRITVSNPSLNAQSISSISEQGDSITFKTNSNQTTAQSSEYSNIIEKLRLNTSCTGTTTAETNDETFW